MLLRHRELDESWHSAGAALVQQCYSLIWHLYWSGAALVQSGCQYIIRAEPIRCRAVVVGPCGASRPFVAWQHGGTRSGGSLRSKSTPQGAGGRNLGATQPRTGLVGSGVVGRSGPLRAPCVHPGCPSKAVAPSRPVAVVIASESRRIGAVQVLYHCSARALPVWYESGTTAVPVQYECDTRVVAMQCQRTANVFVRPDAPPLSDLLGWGRVKRF